VEEKATERSKEVIFGIHASNRKGNICSIASTYKGGEEPSSLPLLEAIRTPLLKLVIHFIEQHMSLYMARTGTGVLSYGRNCPSRGIIAAQFTGCFTA
jgi:hypothetical protein